MWHSAKQFSSTFFLEFHIIGSQGSSTVASNNVWDLSSTFTNSKTFTDNTTFANANSKLFMNTSVVPIPLPVFNLTNIGDQYTSGTGLNASSGTTSACGMVPLAPISGGASSMSASATTSYANELKTMEEDASLLPVYSDAAHWQRKQYVYNEVKNNAALTSNVALNSFYIATTGDAIGKFANVEDKIVLGNYALANSINNGVLPNNILEQNQQTVNNLILRKLINVNYLYTSADVATLYTIANQCTVAGGNSVYQARNLLMTIADNVIEFIDNCNEVPKRMMETSPSPTSVSAVPEQEKKFKLYPNPNNGNMVLDYFLNTNDKGEIIIYDITGKLIDKRIINSSSNQMLISNEQLNNGIYFYIINVNEQTQQNGKIVIIK
jgi:hypothetical protein